MKYVVTGGAGFIGSNLVDKLIEEKNEVIVIDNFSTGKKENCNPNVEYLDLDISKTENNNLIKEALLGCDSVFHCAALARVQPSIKDPIKYEINNTIGIVNMLKSAVDSKVKRFIYSASSSVYGPTENFPSSENHLPNPISPYANQKYYGELCCRMFTKVYGLETVSLRYFNVYGERQNLGGAYATVVGIFLKQKLDNVPFTVNGDGNQRRDFTYVGDVVNANILASYSSNVGKGEAINIGAGKNYSINELAEMIGGRKEHLKPVNEPFQNLADITKAKKVLNWEPKMEINDWIKRYKILMEI
jgi:UDP-glucose 4-epimerase